MKRGNVIGGGEGGGGGGKNLKTRKGNNGN